MRQEAFLSQEEKVETPARVEHLDGGWGQTKDNHFPKSVGSLFAGFRLFGPANKERDDLAPLAPGSADQ